MSSALGRIARGARNYAPAPIARWAAPACRFVIVSNGRSGSELLVSLLNCHPDIVCDGELLGVHRAFPDAFVEAQAARAGLRGARAHGWKVLYLQLGGFPEAERRVHALHEKGYRIILLERRNLVQQAISWIRAETSQYHYQQDEDLSFEPSAIDPVRVLSTASWVDEANTLTARLERAVPSLKLVYEDDLADGDVHQRTVDRICEHLGLRSARVTSHLVKTTPPRTRDMITNFDEVAALFGHTPYASLLGDEEAGPSTTEAGA